MHAWVGLARMQILSFDYWGLTLALLVAYYCASRIGQNWLLLLASLGFCASWDYRSALVLIASSALDYGISRYLAWDRPERTRRLALVASVLLNLAVLALLKYARFWAPPSAADARSGDWATLSSIGVSFYSLVRLTHTFDVFFRSLQPARSALEFMVGVSFYPLLTAGPIERMQSLLPQLSARRSFQLQAIYEGSWLIGLGLFKKVFIADHCALLVKRLLEPEPTAAVSSISTWLGVYAYALQIYADFAGYTDLARGTARLFGVHVMENFAAPYAATSLAQYWQRWHISLSSFLEDYVHRPLSLVLREHGELGAVCALWVTFLLSGLWHGTGWTFLLWGALHGAGLSVYALTRKQRKRLKKRLPPRLFATAAWLITFHFVCVGYVFFRAGTLPHAWLTLQRLGSGIALTEDVGKTWTAVAFYAALLALLDQRRARAGELWIFEQKLWVRAACYGALLLGVVRMFAPGSEFIYAEF